MTISILVSLPPSLFFFSFSSFGYVEHVANEMNPDAFDLAEIISESLLLVHSKARAAAAAAAGASLGSQCLVSHCEEYRKEPVLEDPSCPRIRDFKSFMVSAEKEENYPDLFLSIFKGHFTAASLDMKGDLKNRLDKMFSSTLGPGDPTCSQMVADFDFLSRVSLFVANLNSSDILPGSLLQWLYTNAQNQQSRRDLFRKYFPVESFPSLYSSSLGTEDHIPIPEVVHTLTDKVESILEGGGGGEDKLRNITFSEDLLHVMRLSVHPPHVAGRHGHRSGSVDFTTTPNPAFPFCWYRDKLDEGLRFGPYGEQYCQGFQTTINEVGLCYSYNNYDLGKDPEAGPEAIQVRNVAGCGKKKGLQVIVDTQKLATKPAFAKAHGFKVFVTVPGVVTHKVPFDIDPNFQGEHSIYLHGIHYIDSSEEFKEWNKENMVCYLPMDKNLTYFSTYTQDNCLLECRYNKIASRCGCSPWYLNQNQFQICGVVGNACFQREFQNYQEDLEDRSNCDCRYILTGSSGI